MELEIRKQSATYWKHVVINGQQRNTVVDPKIIAFVANNSLTIDYGGKNGDLLNYKASEVKVYDDVSNGSEEVFSDLDELVDRLTELQYIGLANYNSSSSDYSIQLKLGNIIGSSGDNKFGRNPDLDDADLPETVWVRGGLWRPPVSGAQQWNIVSQSANDTAAGTGAQSVTVFGIDDEDNLASETIIMNGTTNVLTNTLFRMIFRIRTTTVGTFFGSNEGIITGSPATDGGILAQMNTGVGSTEMAVLAVPANTICFIKSYYGNIRRNSASSAQVDMELQALTDWDNPLSSLDTIHKMSYTINGANPHQLNLNPPILVPQKSYILMTVVGISDDNTAFGAGFDYEFHPMS